MHIYNNNIAQLHIPKTGGTSLHVFLKKELGLVKTVVQDTFHEPLVIKSKLIDLENYNIITTIRDPLEIVVSLWHWAQINNDNRYSNLKIIRRLNWNEYIDWYIENRLSYEDWLLINGKLPNNLYFIRLNNLMEDLDIVLNKQLNLKLTFENYPHVYKTNHQHYLNYFNDLQIEKIKKFEEYYYKYIEAN